MAELTCVFDCSARCHQVSEGLAKLLGYASSEMIGQSLFQFMHFADHGAWQRGIEATVDSKTGTSFAFDSIEVRYLSRNHQRVYWLVWTGVYRPEEGLFYVTGYEVTAQREVQEWMANFNRILVRSSGPALFRAATLELARLFRLDDVAVVRIFKLGDRDLLGRIEAHASFEGELPPYEYMCRGTACESVLGARGPRRFNHPSRLFPRDRRFRGLASEIYVGCPIFGSNGEKPLGLLWAVGDGSSVDSLRLEPVMNALSLRLSSEFEREVREIELPRQLNWRPGILHTAPDFLFMFDSNLVFMDCFFSKDEELAASPRQLRGRRLDQVLPRTMVGVVKEAVEEAKLTRKVVSFDTELAVGEGVEAYSGCVLAGTDDRIFIYSRKTTEEKRLRDEQSRLTAILEASTDLVGLVGSDRKISYLNPAARRFIGLSEQADPGEVTIDSLQPPWARQVRDNISLPLARRDGTWEGETALLDKDGNEVPFSQLIVAHQAPDGSGAIRFSTVMRDIRERKQYETRIAEQQSKVMASAKMAALGEMAAGIAHEINNPLAVILARTERLAALAERRGAVATEQIAEVCERVFHMVDRIARIVRSLRFFARDSEKDPFEARSIQSIIDETLELCEMRFRHHDVRVELRMSRDEMLIRCRPVQISQVILNLLSNAFDAVQTLQERWIRIEVQRMASSAGRDQIEVAVIDSGGGVPPEIADKIMQPFFTTKMVGTGTGLGLSISSGIIEEHGGVLELDFAFQATRFYFRLPVHEGL